MESQVADSRPALGGAPGVQPDGQKGPFEQGAVSRKGHAVCVPALRLLELLRGPWLKRTQDRFVPRQMSRKQDRARRPLAPRSSCHACQAGARRRGHERSKLFTGFLPGRRGASLCSWAGPELRLLQSPLSCGGTTRALSLPGLSFHYIGVF